MMAGVAIDTFMAYRRMTLSIIAYIGTRDGRHEKIFKHGARFLANVVSLILLVTYTADLSAEHKSS